MERPKRSRWDYAGDSPRYPQKQRRYDRDDRRDCASRETSCAPIPRVRLIVSAHDTDDAQSQHEQMCTLLERATGVLRLLQEAAREQARAAQKMREEHAASMKKLIEQNEQQATFLKQLVELKEKQQEKDVYDEQKSKEKLLTMYS